MVSVPQVCAGWFGWMLMWCVVYVTACAVVGLVACGGWLGVDVARCVCGGMRDPLLCWLDGLIGLVCGGLCMWRYARRSPAYKSPSGVARITCG